MELIRLAVRRSHVSDLVHALLNVVLALVLLWLVIALNQPYFAFGVVLLSKWRVFAVRPRFWFAHLQANLVDVLVGISIVMLMWLATGALLVQCLLVVAYIGWLLVIKPRSSQRFVFLQAGISQFLAIMTLFSVAHMVDVVWIVAAGWLIGYVCARHVLDQFHEQETTLLSLAWGVFVAEMSWLTYHWTDAYGLSQKLMLPQIAITISLLGFLAVKYYHVYVNKGSATFHDVRAPGLFALIVIAILLLRILSDIFQNTI